MIARHSSRSSTARAAANAMTGLIACLAVGCAAAVDEPGESHRAPSVSTARSPGGAGLPAAPVDTGDAAEKAVVESFEADGLAFVEAVAALQAKSKLPIVVNWTAIEGGGVSRQTPITVPPLKRVPLAKVLDVILSQAGGGVTLLDYAVDLGVITITTADDQQRLVATKTYDVRDLLEQLAPIAADADDETRRRQHESAVEQLTQLIYEPIASESWKVNGGLVGTIREAGGVLVVTNSPRVQRKVATLLDELRQNFSATITVDTRVLSISPGRLASILGDEHVATTRPSTKVIGGAAAERLNREANAATTLSSPRLMLLKGQHAKIQATTSQRYIEDFKSSESADGGAKFEPEIATAETGSWLDISATTTPDRTKVRLSVQSKVARLIAMRDFPFAGDASGTLRVQVPELETTVGQSTTWLARDQLALVPCEPTDPKQEASAVSTYLVIRADAGE